MSKTMVLYFLSVLVMWLPAYVQVRHTTTGGGLVERAITASMLAIVWPLAVPAVELTRRFARRDAVSSTH